MGNVNEPANEKGSNAAEVPGILPDNQEHNMLDSVNLDSDDVLPSSSSSTQDETDSVDSTRLLSPVLPVVIVDSNDIQSSLDRTCDTSTQSSNTSFPISESALPATFDISADISSNPDDLSDYFVAPSLTHLGTADRITLFDMPHVATQSERSLDPSSTLLPIFPERDALGSDCTSAMSLDSDSPAICEHVNQPPPNRGAKHDIGTYAGVSHPPDRASDLSFASLAASVHGITSVAVHEEILITQPSEIIAETTNSTFYTATHALHQRPRENLAPIDNIVSVIADAVPTKPIFQKSGTYTDKDAILASIPLAATYAEAANLAAQHPELAKELLSRPLLTPSQSRAPAVPTISYTAPDSTAQGVRSRDHRRTRRGGARNDHNHFQSLSGPTRELEYMQDEHAGGRSNVLPDDRRGRLDLPPHLDREPLRWYKRNTSDSSQASWPNSSQPRAHAQAVSHEPKCYNASRELPDADASHNPFTLSQVPSHETRNTNVLDRSNADEWSPLHDPWLSETQQQDNPQDRAAREQLATLDETRHVDGPDAVDEWVHSHDPWISGNQLQSSTHIHAVSDTIRNKDTSTQRSNVDEWRPALGPSISENVCTKSDGLPGSQSPVFHNTASESYAPDATADQWQAPHDPWLMEQPVIGDTISISRQYPPSVVQQDHPVHIHSQPTASILSQPDDLRGANGKVDVSPDLYRILRQLRVADITLTARRHLRDEPESEERVPSADVGGGRQMEPHSAPPGEPRSASSPPRIIAHFNNERPYKMSGWHFIERDKAVAAMVPTRTLNTEEVIESNAPSLANFRGAGSRDVPSQDLLHLCANNVDLVPERNPRLSRTMSIESRNSALDLRLSHATTRPDVSWLERDATRDTTLRPIYPLHSNSIDCLTSIPLASISQNNLASHVSQYPNSSNFYPNAETTVHLQLGFDPRANGWHANPGGKERGQVNGLYNTCPDPRNSLPARAKIDPSLHAFGPREMHQQGYEPDPRKEQRLADVEHYAAPYRVPRDVFNGTSPRHIYNRRQPTEKGHGNTYESINWREH